MAHFEFSNTRPSGRTPLRTSDLLLVAMSLLLFLANPLAFYGSHQRHQPQTTDFYVSTTGFDANDGSRRRPWATITHAARQIGPGATVHVGSGVYSAPVSTATSGKPDARIRFVSDSKWGAILRIDSTASFGWVNSGAYVDIEGFEVTGHAAIGIYNTAPFVRIVSNHLHRLSPTCDGNGGAGITLAEGAHDSIVLANVVYDVKISAACTATHGVGIYVQTTATVICNNLVYANANQGIQMWHGASGGMIANNTVFSNGKEGILIGCGDRGCEWPGPKKNDNTIVINNISIFNDYGIREYGSTGTHNTYRNNLVYRNGKDIELQNGNTATGILKVDPAQVFVDWRSDGTGDYRLRPASVAVRGGTSEGLREELCSLEAGPDGSVNIGANQPGPDRGQPPQQ
jgi:parallel beta-helix repeat protein